MKPQKDHQSAHKHTHQNICTHTHFNRREENALSTEDLVAAYVNGQLSVAATVQLENAAQDDAELAAEITFQQQLKHSMHISAITSPITQQAQPQFSQIAQQLQAKKHNQKSLKNLLAPLKEFINVSGFPSNQWVAGTALSFCTLCAVAGLMLFNNYDQSQLPAEYITLSDDKSNNPRDNHSTLQTNENGQKGRLRIVASDSQNYHDLLAEYQERISAQFPNTLAFDIETNTIEHLTLTENSLKNDSRVSWLQRVDAAQ